MVLMDDLKQKGFAIQRNINCLASHFLNMLFPTGVKLEVFCMLMEQICFVVFNGCKSVKDALVCTC